MPDSRVRSICGLAVLAAVAAVVVARAGRPVGQLLEGLGVMDPFEPDTGPGLRRGGRRPRLVDLERRVAAVEKRWEQFDRHWPEPYLRARATAAFESLVGPQ